MFKKKDAVGIGILAISCAYLFISKKFPFGSLVEPGSGFVPTILGVLGIVISIIVIVFDHTEPKENNAERIQLKQLIQNPVTGYLAVILFTALLFETLGSLLGIFLLVFFLAKVSKLSGLIKPFIISALTSVGMQVVFQLWLKCPLPKGVMAIFL